MNMAIREEHAAIAAFAEMAEGTSSLFLLRAIDTTVDHLEAMRKQLSGLARSARGLASQVASMTVIPGVYIDEDDELLTSLQKSYQDLERGIPHLLKKQSYIDRDGSLRPHQRERLHDSYDACVSSLRLAVEATKDLRAAVISHDLASEPRDIEILTTAELLQQIQC